MAKRSFYVSQEIETKLSIVSKKLSRSKSFIICQALDHHLSDLLDDLEDYNDAVSELAKIEAGESTITWQDVQKKNNLLT